MTYDDFLIPDIITFPFKTISFIAIAEKALILKDFIFRKKMNGSWFGGGLQVLSDQAGTSNLSNSKIALSGSFIYMLNDNNYLTSGIQAGFIQRSFSMDDLYFDSQITPSGINTGLPNNENISSGVVLPLKSREKYFS